MDQDVMNISNQIQEALAQMDDNLRSQSEATHQGDLNRAAEHAEHSASSLERLQRIVAAASALPERSPARLALQKALAKGRSLALYNQLLLRYSFTGWAAQRMEKRRRSMAYDDRGRPTTALAGTLPALHVSHEGVL